MQVVQGNEKMTESKLFKAFITVVILISYINIVSHVSGVTGKQDRRNMNMQRGQDINRRTPAIFSTVSDKLWENTYGGSGNERVADMIQTADGGFVLAGHTWSYETHDEDFWLVKINASGTAEWTRSYGGTDHDRSNSVIQASDGGFVMAGLTNSFGAGSQDCWLVKTGINGETEWTRTLGGKGGDIAYSIIQTADEGFAIVGETNDFWLVKMDFNGAVQWNQTYGGESSSEIAFSLVQTADGGYALAGEIEFPGGTDRDAWLVKTDASGVEEWNRTYGSSDYDAVFSIIQTVDGGYAMTGYTGDNIGQDFWLVKTDAKGVAQWTRTYGGDDKDVANEIIQTADGGYAMIGFTRSIGAGGTDFWLVKTDVEGEVEWTRTYGTIEGDHGISLVQTPDGGFVLAGYTHSLNTGDTDGWLIKVDSTGTPPDYFTGSRPETNQRLETRPLLIMSTAVIVIVSWRNRKK